MNILRCHSIKYNILMNCILKVSNIIFPLITYPYVLRIIHSNGNGRVAFVTVIANYFIMISSLGIPTYGIKACAKVRDNKEELSKTVQEILTINCISTIFVAAIYFVSIFVVNELREEKELFIIFSLSIFSGFIGMNWLYQALEQYDYIAVRSIFFKIISLLLVLLFVKKSEDYIRYGAITVLTSLGTNIINFVKSFKIIKYKKRKMQIMRHLPPIMSLFAHNIATSIYTSLDVIMIRFFSGENEVGIYDVAIKIKVVLVTFLSSLSDVLLPRMSYYIQNDQKAEFRRVLRLAFNTIEVLSISISVFCIFNARECILILGGYEYIDAVPVMQILSTTIISIGLANIMASQVLIPLNLENKNLLSVSIGATVDVVINIILIPRIGGMGAAIATSIAEIIVLLLLLYYSNKYIKESCDWNKMLYYFIFSISACIMSRYLIDAFFRDSNDKRLIVNCMKLGFSFICFCVAYFGMLTLVKDEFVVYINSLLSKRKD